MGSEGGSDPWIPYRDCSRGLCNEFCPQWCYFFSSPPPPPPSDGGSGTDFSPLIVAVIGIFTSAFFLVTLYLVFWECRRRRGQGATSAWGNWNQDAMVHDQPLQGPGGLDEAFIKSITVYKYKRNGVVEGTDCSVCLSEFEDGESLRVLPKCNHAFHLPCIDTWLRSHSSCPLCRFDIGSAKVLPLELPAEAAQRRPSDHTRVSALEVQTGNRSLAIRDLESGNGNVGGDVHRS